MGRSTTAGAYVTQLARVQVASPCLLLLALGTDDGSSSDVRVLVQIRPQLLHLVDNGALTCVIQSCVRIVCVVECTASHVVVATVDGQLWLVRLPNMRRQQLGVRTIILQEQAAAPAQASNQADDWPEDASLDRLGTDEGGVRYLQRVAGVQRLQYVAHVDALVCTSVLTPTTVIRAILQSDGDTLDADTSFVELDDVEGERTTCVVACSTANAGLAIQWLSSRVLPHGGVESTILVVQGDADGSVRGAVIDLHERKCVATRTLLRLREPVQDIVVLPAVGMRSAALMAVGTSGVATLLVEDGSVHEGQFLPPVSSICLVHGPIPWILVHARGAVRALPIDELSLAIETSSHSDKRLDEGATELPVPPGILCIRVHQHRPSLIALLSASGCLHSFDDPHFGPHPDPDCPSDARDESVDAQHIRILLHDINRVSEQSRARQGECAAIDTKLRELNSAIHFLRLVQAKGMDAVLSCDLRFGCMETGWSAQTKSVGLRVTLAWRRAEQMQLPSFAMWRVQVLVHSSSNQPGASLPSYTFPMVDCMRRERVIVLDGAWVRRQTSGVLFVSCQVLFVPGRVRLIPGAAGRSLASFAIPVLSRRALHLAQLCEPVADFSTNPAILREGYGHEHGYRLDREQEQQAASKQAPEWWPVFVKQADQCGISFPTVSAATGVASSDSTSVPLRVAVQVHRSPSVPSGSNISEDELLALLQTLIGSPFETCAPQWRAACRAVSGKWWVGMKSYAGDLVVLRVATAVERSVELTVHAANVVDLAAMRALILETLGGHVDLLSQTMQQVERTSLALSSVSDTLSDRKSRIEAFKGVAHRAFHGGEPSTMCQDELIQLVAQVAREEAHLLELYWKSREPLGRLVV